MKNFIKNRKGFTLVELVVVIAILGILAGLAIPRFMDATKTARGARIIADMRTVESAIAMNQAKTGEIETNLETLVKNGYLAYIPTAPTGDYIIPESLQPGTVNAATDDNTQYSIEKVTITKKDDTTYDTTQVVLTDSAGKKTLSDLLKKKA